MLQYENLRLKQLELQIRTNINDSGLSIGSVYLLLNSLTLEAESLYNETIQNENVAYINEQQKAADSSDTNTETSQQPLDWNVVVKDTSTSETIGQE